MSTYALVIHGGAGTIDRRSLTPDLAAAYHATLRSALEAGAARLAAGASALDAVEQAVCVLEDSPLFNAGRGAVYTRSGAHEMEAAIMCGHTRRAGAAALLRQVRNPVRLARCVMEQTEHILLAGPGAEDLARQQGLACVPPDWFDTSERHAQWLEARAHDLIQLDHSASRMGTVGAVALDLDGHLAAATSTGGMTNKLDGRLGDTALIGAGTYAHDDTCAISCTGHGEYFIRGMVAYDVACLMAYRGLSLHDAAAEVILRKQVALGGTGGLIGIDAQGHIALPFNSEGMYRGWVRQGEAPVTAIFESETPSGRGPDGDIADR
ncbi:MAG: beta-aspartyl-peptidase [Bacteroidia bacterium]